ncbi:beta-1,6-N-acetylglucosaminyltransferase [Thalassotalea euphylliae]|uniref:beta-1,6-N-acetylglucosaminyltransferase n=1 Tax=Thalassotalea euphylliae TaxID=1655234 RepID=UPI00362ED8B3
MARIAFLCLAHNNFDYLDEVARYYCSDNDAFFLHVDSGVPDQNIKLTHPDIRLLPRSERFRTRWGTYDIVKATISLLKAALNAGDFDRFVLVSGADMPLLTKSALKKRLTADVSYFAQWRLLDYPQQKGSREFFKRHNYHIGWANPGEAYASKSRFKIYRMLLINKLLSFIPLMATFTFDHYIKGSQWWVITADLAKFFIEQLEDPKVARQFANMHAPDEKTFHTLACNSPFNTKIDWSFEQSSLKQGLHYINWGIADGTGGLQAFKAEHIDTAKSLSCCFARKVNREDFDSLIPYIHQLIEDA